jgi:ABC-type sugar transport system permease subunit
MELEVTWARAMRVWWAFFWRNLVALVVAVAAGAALGFVLGAAMSAAGATPRTIQLVIAPVSALIGFAISIVPMRLILGKDFGEFRLILAARDPSQSSAA